MTAVTTPPDGQKGVAMTRWRDPHGNTWTQLGATQPVETGGRTLMLNPATGTVRALTPDRLTDWQQLDELDGQHTLFDGGDDAA